MGYPVNPLGNGMTFRSFVPRAGGLLCAVSVLVQCSESPEPEETDSGPPKAVTLSPATPPVAAAVDDPTAAVTLRDPRLGPHDQREFAPLADEDRAPFEALTGEFFASTDLDRRLEILDEIEEAYYGDQLLPFVDRILALGQDELSVRAVEMLQGNVSPAILAVLEKALASPSEDVRLAAATAGAHVRDDALVDYYRKIFADPSIDVQLQAIESVDAQSEPRRVQIFRAALQSKLPELQVAAVGIVHLTATRQSVDVLFEALDSPHADVKDEARFALEFLVGEIFSSGGQAREWWGQNRNRFDNDLAPAE